MAAQDSAFDYQSAKFAANFKTLFGDAIEIALNLETPYRARVKKTNDFVGSNKTETVSLSLGGGRASGQTVPDSNERNMKSKIVSKVQTTGRWLMNRRTIIAGSRGNGAFEIADKLAAKGVVDSVNLNLERQCFGNGKLGTIASSGVSGSNPYTLTISDATWVQANFLLGDYVNIETGNPDQFEITAIDSANKQITVNRLDGTQVPADGDDIYLQYSEGNEAVGYAQAFDSSITSLFNINKQAGWRAHTVDAGGANISTDYLADACIDQQVNTGMPSTEIHASPQQFKNLLAATPNPQYYQGVAKSGEFKHSYKGLALLSPVSTQELPILINRFIHNKEVYLINNMHSMIMFAPQFGWIDTPNRLDKTLNYEWIFGGEWAHEYHPSFQGQVYNLAA